MQSITNPTVHLFESTSDAYDETQTRDDIRDGDVLVVESEGVVGILVGAWPAAMTDVRGAFHGLAADVAWSNVDGRDYSASADEASAVIAEWREWAEHVDELVPEHEGDERGLADHFPVYSRVSVRHAFGGHELARGEVVGYVLGWHDSGSPESGPGPVERCELVRVKCDDGQVRNVYPGDVVDDSEVA